MIKRSLQAIAATWVAGLVILLPVALTFAVLAWAFSLVNRLVGPSSSAGRMFAAIGYSFTSHPGLQYLCGTLLLIVSIYVLGLIVQSGLKGPLRTLTGGLVRRIPIVGAVYSLADRFVGLLDRTEAADIGTMSPVWCFFGGEGAAVLALAPGAEPIHIGDRRYLPVLVPSAPVPFSGALVYVPVEWLRPANIGVDTLTAIYVSLGITPPPSPDLARISVPRSARE